MAPRERALRALPLKNGQTVLLDRASLSTCAYQGAGRGLPMHEVVQGCLTAQSHVMPDATLILTASDPTLTARKEARSERKDRIMRAGVIVATDRLALGTSYLLALRAEDVMPPGIYVVIVSRWLSAPAQLLQGDPRVGWFVDAFTSRYSVRRAAMARANLEQR